MDSYRDHPTDFEPAFSGGEEPADPVRLEIGTDERRMHVRAYNYWASLLDGRDYPSIEDLEPGDLKDFAPHSVLLDFTAGRDNPATPYIGEAIRQECGLGDNIQSIDDVPSRSLLSRLTDHYMQIIANRAPVGFEAEFENQRSDNICYRGILMPFSSDGDTIDFIYGVINWKTVAEAAADAASEAEQVPFQPQVSWTDDDQEPPTMPIHGVEELAEETLELSEAIADETPDASEEVRDDTRELSEELADDAVPFSPDLDDDAIELSEALADDAVPFSPDLDDDTLELSEALADDAVPFSQALADDALEPNEALVADAPADDDELEEIELGEDAGLGDRLWAARENAEAAKAADGRSRTALYRALSHAYDFALASKQDPDGYAELLEESAMKPQARAPMTPIVKLVFGIDYDKARLTEFAAALSHAERQQVELGGFLTLIEAQVGGLKALVAAERQARRPEPKPDTRTEAARSKLRSAEPLAAIESDEEFALVLTRRATDGSHEVVAMVDDPALVERAIRRAGA